MLQLNSEAQRFLAKFGDHPVMSKETRQAYRNIESAYGRLLRVFLFVNQDALLMLPRENIDDINSAISRVYESLFWARRSLTSQADPGYTAVEWLLISDRQDGMVTESYKLVTNRLIKYCPASLFLENALIRLMNSYNIAADVTRISLGLISARRNRSVDLKKKRTGQSFVLEANPNDGNIADVPPSQIADRHSRKIIDASRAI